MRQINWAVCGWFAMWLAAVWDWLPTWLLRPGGWLGGYVAGWLAVWLYGWLSLAGSMAVVGWLI